MEAEEQQPVSFASLQATGERILTDRFGDSVSIARATLLTDIERRNRIWRCELQGAASVPQTVIIKQVTPEGYNPSQPDSWDTSRFFGDWAGARFLTECAPKGAGHGPAYYGGDVERGFIILEDMGEHISLVDSLLHGDAASATDALTEFARRLGRMHADTIGKEHEYRAIQRDISPAWADSAAPTAEVRRDGIEKDVAAFAEICTRLDVEAGSPWVDEAMQHLRWSLERIAEPGPFLAFIHGDPCPDNVFYSAPELRLIDFEFARFGHALRDGLYGHLPFPTCWCANEVPGEVVHQMEAVYRAELSRACPEALDDERFAQEACAVSAFWVLNSLQWHLDAALKEDGQWGIAGLRARLFTRLEHYRETCRRVDAQRALSEIAARLLAELRKRWPEAEPLPTYPAFRQGGAG